jgi:hypothetical protein
MLALAAQIDAGKVSSDALTQEVQKVVDAAAAASVELRSDLKKLHDVLDPIQRQQFVSGFRAALEKRAALVDASAQVDEWARVLRLTGEQKQKALAVVGEDKVSDDVEKARVEVVFAAFPGDTFSMDDLLPGSAIRHRVREMLADIVAAAEGVTAILTPDQRTTAASMIRERASATGSGPSVRPAGPSRETAGTVSEPLWVGRGRYYRSAYRRPGAFGFNRTYATGFGGIYLL